MPYILWYIILSSICYRVYELNRIHTPPFPKLPLPELPLPGLPIFVVYAVAPPPPPYPI